MSTICFFPINFYADIFSIDFESLHRYCAQTNLRGYSSPKDYHLSHSNPHSPNDCPLDSHNHIEARSCSKLLR